MALSKMRIAKMVEHLALGQQPTLASVQPVATATGAVPDATDKAMIEKLQAAAKAKGLDIAGGSVRRTSSRFCLGVEHGDYNGTELFGVGTDRFIWLAYKPNGTDKINIFSENFPDGGVVSFTVGGGDVPAPVSPEVAALDWAQFPFGVDHVMHVNGLTQTKGYDAVLIGNIPGGGMSRSASLCINLILTGLEVSGLCLKDEFDIINLSQAVENDYTGSPCGQLDQIMIYYAKAGMGTHYNPADRSIKYVPIGANAHDWRIVALDTGTTRHGLENSTYNTRAIECKDFAAELASAGFVKESFAEVQDQALYDKIVATYGGEASKWLPHLERLKYIYGAQQRFYKMLEAWRTGDIEKVGAIFRRDGIGLRDEYVISGPELESMCDIVRSVPGVLGERMLGGGDKGASGCLVLAEAAEAVAEAVAVAYPRARPDYADKYATHVVQVCDGVTTFEGIC